MGLRVDFSVDNLYLKVTGRDKKKIQIVEEFCKETNVGMKK